MATYIRMRNFIPIMFLLLAIYMSMNVPGEGVANYTDVNTEFATFTGDIGAGAEVIYKYRNGSTWLFQEPTTSGTLDDMQYQYSAAAADYTDYISAMYFPMNMTVDQAVNATITRCSFAFSWTDLGVKNPNTTTWAVYSVAAAVSVDSGNLMVANTNSPDIQLNSTNSFSGSITWTLGTVTSHSGSYGDEYLFLIIYFSDGAVTAPYLSEVWNSAIVLQSSAVSTISTWIYSLIGSFGCLLGAYWLLPYNMQFLNKERRSSFRPRYQRYKKQYRNFRNKRNRKRYN